MFTGIIEEVGQVHSIDRSGDSIRLRIAASKVVSDVSTGDSIAVNGVCLTVTEFDESGFWSDVMQVTLDYTAIGVLQPGSNVNLERAMPINGRFGGHIVQGHVDGTATLISRNPSENWEVFRFQLDDTELDHFVVKKGSIAINGVSLTVAECSESEFEVSLIPTTLSDTMLDSLTLHDKVNVECDVLAKYVDSMRTQPRKN